MGIGNGQKISSKQVFVENFTSTVINSGNKTDSTQRNNNNFKSMKSRQLPPKSSVFPVIAIISVTITVTINGGVFPLPFLFRYYKYFRYYYNYVIVFPLSFPLSLFNKQQHQVNDLYSWTSQTQKQRHSVAL